MMEDDKVAEVRFMFVRCISKKKNVCVRKKMRQGKIRWREEWKKKEHKCNKVWKIYQLISSLFIVFLCTSLHNGIVCRTGKNEYTPCRFHFFFLFFSFFFFFTYHTKSSLFFLYDKNKPKSNAFQVAVSIFLNIQVQILVSIHIIYVYVYNKRK